MFLNRRFEGLICERLTDLRINVIGFEIIKYGWDCNEKATAHLEIL